MAKKQNFTYAVGRRKTSSARVRLFIGKGESTINGQPIEKYFPGEVAREAYLKPFRVVEATDKYHVTVRVVGGGKEGQLDAVVHGIARALALAKKDAFRPQLKKLGLLTRDARERERRKVGTGGKARRQKQSPKR
jgi:small subunit ribosomal protein S9